MRGDYRDLLRKPHRRKPKAGAPARVPGCDNRRSSQGSLSIVQAVCAPRGGVPEIAAARFGFEGGCRGIAKHPEQGTIGQD